MFTADSYGGYKDIKRTGCGLSCRLWDSTLQKSRNLLCKPRSNR